jgi:paired amphipathic helix protein Sin3a
MLENLCIQPIKTCELMLKRLRRNRNGSMQQKERNKAIWKELCENNFYKSLDHKSFYFRQSEKKSLNTKGNSNNLYVAFVAEVKERYNERNNPHTSIEVKRGGTDTTPYFINQSVLRFDLSSKTPIEGDKLLNE